MFAFRTSSGPVEVAFTDRAGGVSAPPFDELNLASGGGDDPEAVAENLCRVQEGFAGGRDRPVALMRQVHGATVARVVDGAGEAPEADALVSDRPGVTLVVRVADCVPVLMADASAGHAGVVAAVHVGRPGLVAGVLPAAVDAMVDLGADRGRIAAWIGPHVCGRCYEVPATMREDVARVVPASYGETTWGTPAVDLGAGVRAQLVGSGVVAARTTEVGRCTREDPALYSYRRDGAHAGRLAGLVRLRTPEESDR